MKAACDGLKYSVQLTQGAPGSVTVISGSADTGTLTVGTGIAPSAPLGTATISVPAADASIVTGVSIVIYS